MKALDFLDAADRRRSRAGGTALDFLDAEDEASPAPRFHGDAEPMPSLSEGVDYGATSQPSAAPPPGDDIEQYHADTTLGQRFLNPLEAGYLGLQRDVQGVGVDVASRAAQRLESARSTTPGQPGAPMGALPRVMRSLTPPAAAATTQGIESKIGQSVDAMLDLGAHAEAIPQHPSVARISQAKTFGEAADEFWRDPLGVVLSVGMQSLPASAPGLIAGTAGAAVGGPIAGALLMGAGSAGAEYVSSVLEGLQDEGIDMRNREAVIAAFRNRDLMERVRAKAAIRGGIIGGADAATFGIASRTLAPKAIASRAVREMVNVPAQLGVGMAGGVVGETGAQIATEGRITKPGQIWLEAVGETFMAPAEVAGARFGASVQEQGKPGPGYQAMRDDSGRVYGWYNRDTGHGVTIPRGASMLTPEDRASPLPDNLIGEGKAIIDDVLRGEPIPPGAPPAIAREGELERQLGAARDELNRRPYTPRGSERPQPIDPDAAATAGQAAAEQAPAAPPGAPSLPPEQSAPAPTLEGLVSFDPGDGSSIQGTVTQVRDGTAEVVDDNGVLYAVPVGELTYEPTQAAPAQPQAAQIVKQDKSGIGQELNPTSPATAESLPQQPKTVAPTVRSERTVEPAAVEPPPVKAAMGTDIVPAEHGNLFVQIGTKRFEIDNLADASAVFERARDRVFSEGGGSKDLETPLIVDSKGGVVGYISQNGRVWPGKPQDWQPGIKPLWDNATPAEPVPESIEATPAAPSPPSAPTPAPPAEAGASTVRSGIPASAGARMATPEGRARIDQAKQEFRRVINAEFATPAERADAIERARNAVHEAEAEANVQARRQVRERRAAKSAAPAQEATPRLTDAAGNPGDARTPSAAKRDAVAKLTAAADRVRDSWLTAARVKAEEQSRVGVPQSGNAFVRRQFLRGWNDAVMTGERTAAEKPDDHKLSYASGQAYDAGFERAQNWMEDNPKPAGATDTIRVETKTASGKKTAFYLLPDANAIDDVARNVGKLSTKRFHSLRADDSLPSGMVTRAELARIERAVRDRLEQIGIAGDIAGRAVSRIRGMAADGRMRAANGRYYRRMIELALDNPEGEAGIFGVLDHEIIHALRDLDLIDAKEWAALVRAAKARPKIMAWVERNYGQAEAWVQDEEAVAELFRIWAAEGQETGGLVGRVMARISQFLEALGNALRGLGYVTADQIMGRIESGEVGARERGVDRGGRGERMAARGDGYTVPWAELAAKPDVDIVRSDNRYAGMPIGAMRRAALQDGLPLRGVYRNADKGWDISISRTSTLEKGTSGRQDQAQFEAVLKLPELIERAIYVKSWPDRKADVHVKAMHRLYAPLQHRGRLYRVGLTVKEFADGRLLYDHHAAKISEPVSMEEGHASEDAAVASQPTGSKISVARLLDGVKDHEGRPLGETSSEPDDNTGAFSLREEPAPAFAADPRSDIAPDVQRRMVEAFNFYLPTIEEQWGEIQSRGSERWEHETLSARELEDIYGDPADEMGDYPEAAKPIIAEHGRAVRVVRDDEEGWYGPDDPSAPSEAEVAREAVEANDGLVPVASVAEMTDTKSRRMELRTALQAAMEIMAKAEGWHVVKVDGSGHSGYFRLERGFRADEAVPLDADGDRLADRIAVGVRVSTHPNTSRFGHATRGKADVHINIAPGADTFESAIEMLRSARLDENGYLRFDDQKATLWSLRDAADALDPPFFSALTRGVEGLQQGKASPAQWWASIRNLTQRGVKQEEIDWSGVQQWLQDQKGQVSKADLVAFLKANEVGVQEVVKRSPHRYVELDEATEQRLDDWVRSRDRERAEQGYDPVQLRGFFELAREGDQESIAELRRAGAPEELIQPLEPVKSAVKFGPSTHPRLSLPGGENYRELLLTLPEKTGAGRLHELELRVNAGDRMSIAEREEYRRLVEQKAGRGNFTSGHFDEPNVLAHVRFNERTDAEGRRVLFIEEIQSDWHQRGRRQGYVGELTALPEGFKVIDHGRRFSVQGPDGFNVGAPNITREGAIRDALATLQREGNANADRYGTARVPDAPFKTTWPELAMKRMVRWAAENGFDRVAWTTGEQQAARYDLSKQVAEVAYAVDGRQKGTLQVFDHDKKIVANPTLKGDQDLADHIGKEAAEKLLNQPTRTIKDQFGTWNVLGGLDLKVGGEGMAAFYDRMLVNFANKLGKKFGAKVGTTELRTADMTDDEIDKFGNDDGRMPAHSLDITPAMRDSVMQGQPLFSLRDAADSLVPPRAPSPESLLGSTARLVGPMGWFARFAQFPRMIAARYPAFTDVYRAAVHQFQRRDEIVSDLSRLAAPYYQLDPAEKDNVNRLLEIGRLQGLEFSPKADGTITAKARAPRASLSKPGDTVALSAREASGYRAIRQAMSRALELFKRQLLIEAEIDPDGPTATPQQIRDLAQDRSLPEAERDRMENLANMIEQVDKAGRSGYVPFTRHGEIAIVVLDAQDKVVVREHVEIDGALDRTKRLLRLSPREIAMMPKVAQRIAALKAEHPGMTVDVRQMPKRKGEGVGDVTLADIDAIAAAAHLDEQTWDAAREKMSRALKERGFRKHFFASQNVPGYSTDFERSIHDYTVGLGNYLARRETAPMFDDAIGRIGDLQGQLRDYANKYREYINNPVEEWHGLRQATFMFNLAGRVSSAVINLSQVPFIAAPWLGQFGNPVKVSAELARAYKDAAVMLSASKGLELFDPAKAPADIRAALKKAWDKGMFVPLETHEAMAVAHNRTKELRGLSRKTQKSLDAFALMFTGAERINRLVTWMAAYRVAQAEGFQGRVDEWARDNALARAELDGSSDAALAERFAEFAVADTQFVLGKVNRPTMMRGVGSALLQFKGFTLQALELYWRMATMHGRPGKIALAGMLTALMVAAGPLGLPGGDDLVDAIEWLWKEKTGIDKDIRTDLRLFLAELTGSARVAEMIMSGIGRGSSADVTQRLGLGRIVPRVDSFGAALGVQGQWIDRLMRTGDAIKAGADWEAAANVMPTALGDPMQAVEWSQTGVRSRATGRVVIAPEKIGAKEIATKALGFTPSSVATERERARAGRRKEHAIDEYRRNAYTRRARAMVEIQRAREEGDDPAAREATERLKDVMAEVAEHNKTALPENRVIWRPETMKRALMQERHGLDVARGKGARQARGAKRTIDAYYDELRQ